MGHLVAVSYHRPKPHASAHTPNIHQNCDFGAAIITTDGDNNAIHASMLTSANSRFFPLLTTDQECTVTGKTASKPINSYNIWLKTWANYEELLIYSHPRGAQIFSACSMYRRLIQKCQELHTWSAVYCYDMAFRVNLGNTKSLFFEVLDIHCYVANLNAATLKKDNQKCWQCQAISPTVHECPFPVRALSHQNTQSLAAVSCKGEIFKNFNAGHCNFPVHKSQFFIHNTSLEYFQINRKVFFSKKLLVIYIQFENYWPMKKRTTSSLQTP